MDEKKTVSSQTPWSTKEMNIWFSYFTERHDDPAAKVTAFDRDPRFFEEDREVFGKDLIFGRNSDLTWFGIYNWGEDRWEPDRSTLGRNCDSGNVIHFIHRGKCIMNGVPLSVGQAFMTAPGIPYDIVGDSTAPLGYYWVQLRNGRDLMPVNGSVIWRDGVAFFDFSHCFDDVCRLLRKGLFLTGDFHFMAYGLYGLLYEIFSRICAKEAPGTENLSPTVRTAVEYIRRNYAYDITVNSVAETVHVSRTHLRRLFLSELGMTPKERIQRCRVEAAVILLGAHPEMSMANLAEEVGYPSYSQFIHAFRQIYGCTPGEFAERSGNSVGTKEKGSSSRSKPFPRGEKE